jgi:chromosome partitioning protein
MNYQKQHRKQNIANIIQKLHDRQKALTMIVGNQKGGVGKTTNSCLIGYRLAKMGVNTLIVDLDPQANATKMLTLTRDNLKDDLTVLNKTIMAGIQNGDITDLPINVMENLSFIPSNIDFKNFGKYVIRKTGNDYDLDHYLSPFFEPLKSEYDLIIVDTPPFVPEINDNAITMADYVLISLQTQQGSFDGAVDFLNDTLIPKADLYNLNIEVVGILPILFDNKNRVDLTILEEAKKQFGEQNMFKKIINQKARIKRFPMTGITDENLYEHRIMHMYQDVADELIERLGIFMGVTNDKNK